MEQRLNDARRAFSQQIAEAQQSLDTQFRVIIADKIDESQRIQDKEMYHNMNEAMRKAWEKAGQDMRNYTD